MFDKLTYAYIRSGEDLFCNVQFSKITKSTGHKGDKIARVLWVVKLKFSYLIKLSLK